MSKKFVLEKMISGYLVKYYLTQDNSEELVQDTNLFGVEIELFDGGILKTHESIKKITQSHEFALEIIELLAQKNVTPNSLLCVIDEICDKFRN